VLVAETPVITMHPANQQICTGRLVDTLEVAYSGGVGTPTYQWYKNGSPIPDGTSYTLQLNNIAASTDAGTYQVEIHVPACDLSSNAFNLLVNCTPLPVRLIEFTAYNHNGVAQLNWTTYSGQSDKGFSIERSNNGSNWKSIGWVNGKVPDSGNSKRLQYTYTDRDIQSAAYYYRLKQEDFSGRTVYSPVQWLKFNPLNDIVIVPNPARNEATIKGLQGDELIRITNGMGQIMIERRNAPANSYTIQVSGWTPGIYLVQVVDSTGRAQTQRLMVE
jgi:hypothetical protein